MGAGEGPLAGQGWRSGSNGCGQPAVRQRRAVGAALRRPLARPARAIWQVEERPYAVLALGEGRGLGASVRNPEPGSRQHIPDARHDLGPRPPTGGDRKRGGKNQALGRSRGGLTTKIHMLADALGRPVKFKLSGGQVHDVVAAPDMIEDVEGDALIADKAYDSNAFRARIAVAGMQAVIPSNRSRKTLIPHDRILYKMRNRIERCF